jgi:uncharacterized RDD family membrane protein YckC
MVAVFFWSYFPLSVFNLLLFKQKSKRISTTIGASFLRGKLNIFKKITIFEGVIFIKTFSQQFKIFKMESIKFSVTDDLLATRGQRFFNCVLDLLIVHIILVSIGTTVVIIGDITNNFDLTNWAESTTTLERLFFWAVMLFLYYFLTEAYFSRTFAKYFTKTIVVTKDGSRPKKRTIVIRTLSRFIPLECLTFLGANVRGGLHDLFSDTYVVRKHEFNHKKGVVAFP